MQRLSSQASRFGLRGYDRIANDDIGFDRRNAMEWKRLQRDSFNQLRMTILRLTVHDHSAF